MKRGPFIDDIVYILDEQSLQMVVVVDTNLFVHIYPNTKESYAKLNKNIQSIYVYLANKSLNTFKGYKIRQGAELKLYEVWSVIIPDDQRILSLAEKGLDETINSVGRVLGDHTVLYKYLNPNLFAILAQQGSGAKGSVLVYLIDAVTGVLFFSIFPTETSVLECRQILYQEPKLHYLLKILVILLFFNVS